MNSKLACILPTVSKPTRYIGNELNIVRKDPGSFSLSSPIIRFALAFPDIYDVGMSHLGLKILYQILNSRDDVWAERVYTPWIDMESKMRENDIPLFSLESSSPLKDFDIIGFSLQYEMSYTNVLNMLELAQIPLLAKDRSGDYPLIIAGGPCAFNPEPIADFIDIFAIGDGEEVITEIVDCYKYNRNLDKYQILSKMAEIEGVYVPSLVSLKEQPDGTLCVSNGIKIRKRIVSDLDYAPCPVNFIVPFMRPIHDRAVIEVMRGCSRGCRFCQAGMIYRPVRERSSTVIEELAEKIIKNTGYEELSLSSLSTCDHSSINPIVSNLVEALGKKHVSVSLPSLRTDAFSLELAQEIESAGKTGLTFAPEVATDRLRKVINKDISKSQVLFVAEAAFSSGWDSLKLYFMIGLPTEKEEDVEAIASLVKETLRVARSANRRANLNVSVSTFVPKAHTPFQWERQLTMADIRQRQKLLIERLGRNDRIDVSFHSPQLSYLEGIFARGDRRLGRVLMEAHSLGCKLDGWSELFNFNAWMQAFTRCGIDPDTYHAERDINQTMPYDHIDACLSKDFLLDERKRAYNSQLTPDCRISECCECGVCSQKVSAKLDATKAQDLPPRDNIQTLQNPVSRIRFQFAKRDELKYISHLDLINLLIRAFRRAEIPVAYSHGFSPHPKISFGSVLPVGTTSEAEFADVELESYMSSEDFISRSNHRLPEGLVFLDAREVPLKTPSITTEVGLASYVVHLYLKDFVINLPASQPFIDPDSSIQAIMSMDQLLVDRSQKFKKPKADTVVDVKPYVKSIVNKGYKSVVNDHSDKILELEMILDGANKVRPEELIHVIFNNSAKDYEEGCPFYALEVQKTGSFIEHKGRNLSPMEIIKISDR